MSETEDLMEVQLGLEDESRAISRTRYRSKRVAPWMDAYGPEQDEASLPPGRVMLRRALEPTAQAIGAFLADGKAGKAGRRHAAFDLLTPYETDVKALAYLTLRCGIQAGISQQNLQTASKMVARAIQSHLEDCEFNRLNPDGAAGLQRSLAKRPRASAKRQQAIAAIHEAEGAKIGWTQREQLLLGIKMIELAIDATGLLETRLLKEKSGKAYKRKQVLQVTDKALEWMERQHSRCELLDPLPLPMVVPPRPWTTPNDGGYLQPLIGARLVRSPTTAYLEELGNLDIEPVYAAVNAIQDTAWRINRRILDVMERLTTDGGGIAGLPKQDANALPERPPEADHDAEVEARWKRIRAEIHARNAGERGKRLAVAQQLWVARKLADYPAIYFPYELDWRGRAYVVPQAGPHPQANDTGRALLEFSQGKPVGSAGARWLAIHTANVFGIDKVSFDERVAWVEANNAAIVDSAIDPLDGQRFWTTADKPWAALAACFEWAGYLSEGEAFVSRLPIAIDGSNSGLQHYTALLRDPDAAPHVNLTAADRPGDIYAFVASKAQAMADESRDPAAAPWKDGRITRGIVKPPCMTYVYSATAYAMSDQIKGELARLDKAALDHGLPPHLGGADNFTSANWLSSLLYRLIGETVPAAASAMAWFKSTAKAINKADMPLWWTTPAGLPVMQRYPNTKVGKTEVTFRGKRMQLNLSDDATPTTLAGFLEQPDRAVMDTRKGLNAVAPNFIHSLDAAHLMLTINAASAEGIDDVAVIHDSFGTHAADTDRLSRILRETFVQMYETNPLAQFRDELLKQIDDSELRAEVPHLPTMGELDLKAVLNATYMFA